MIVIFLELKVLKKMIMNFLLKRRSLLVKIKY